MNRNQFSLLLYCSAVLYAALSGTYRRACNRDMKAWCIAVDLYEAYQLSLNAPQYHVGSNAMKYLHRV